MNPKKALQYIKTNLMYAKSMHVSVDDQILKSALVYQLLYFSEFNKVIEINSLLFIELLSCNSVQ